MVAPVLNLIGVIVTDFLISLLKMPHLSRKGEFYSFCKKKCGFSFPLNWSFVVPSCHLVKEQLINTKIYCQ